MSKLITKTFYVSDEYIKNLKKEKNETSEPVSFWGHDFRVCYSPQDINFSREVQISWTEPDREVTIKESKFGEIIGEYPLDTNEVSSLIEKLFGAEK